MMPRGRLAFVGLCAAVMIAGAVLAFRSSSRAASAVTQPTAVAQEMAAPDHHHGGSPPSSVSVDARRQHSMGLRTARAERRQGAVEIRAAGVVVYDETRESEVSARLDGWVRDLRANYTGMAVRRGERLFTLYSPELLATENEYLLALAALQQHAQNPTLPETRDHALRLTQAARDRLALWEVSAAEIAALEQRNKALGTTAVLAPRAGVLVEKNVVEGMRITTGQRLYRLADLSSVWVDVSVPEREIRAIRRGQAAAVQLDAFPGDIFHGRTAYVYPSLAAETRTVKVRVQLANPDGRLRPGMYGTVVVTAGEDTALVVPADAVVEDGRRHLVFIAADDGAFTPRAITMGRRFGATIEVLSGLEPGEPVATGAGAAFLLDAARRR